MGDFNDMFDAMRIYLVLAAVAVVVASLAAGVAIGYFLHG